MGRYDMRIGPSVSDLLAEKQMQSAQIDAMNQQGQLRQLQMMEAQRSMQDDQQLRALLPELMKGGDPQGMLKNLMASGNPGAIQMAAKVAPVLSAMQKDIKTSWQGAGDRLIQLDANGQPTGVTMPMGPTPKEFQPSDVTRLIMERDSVPIGDPRRNIYDQAIKKATTHQPATSVSYGAPVAGVDAAGKPVFFQPSKGGGVPSLIPGVAPAPREEKAPTEAEAKAAFYAGNMRAASKAYDALEANGYDPIKIGAQIDTAIAGGVSNPAAGKLAQQAKQAQSQWSEQMLRMLTGAAATKDEIARNNATYFPQIGDDKAVIEQKKEMRRQAEQGLFEASGRAKQRVDVQTAPKVNTSQTLPNPSTLPNGAIVTDTVSGRRLIVNNGKYQPAR